VTNHTAEFQRVDNLELDNWTRPSRPRKLPASDSPRSLDAITRSQACRGALYARAGNSASRADLCLIRMSELFPRHSVITVDHEDFRVYRRNEREAIPLILPPGV